VKIASIAEVKAKLSAYLKASEEGPVIVTRNGRAVAVLITPQDEDDLERLIFAYSTRLKRLLEASNSSIESGKGIPHEAFWRDIETSERRKRTRR
jgi:prevent-host-death family protein